MRRWRSSLAAGVVGLVAGAVGVTALQSGQTPIVTAITSVSSSTSSTASSTTVAAASTTVVEPPDGSIPSVSTVLVVWTSGGLPAGLATDVQSLGGVSLVSEIRSDLVWLDSDAGDGFVVPVEASAVDDAYARIAPAEWTITLAGLQDGEVVLGESSASLRSAVVGDVLSTGARDLDVVGVLPDQVVGAAEIVTTITTGSELGVTTPRYLLVTIDGDRTDFERSVREVLPEGMAVRIRAPGETPFLRHGDAVLPQVIVKSGFGEFSLRLDGSGSFDIHSEWIEDNLATVEVPLLGQVTCHVGMLDSLRGAMAEVERSNLGFLVETFDGCYNPRFIGGTRSLSRHAWGVAVDLNYAANPTGQVTVQDPRLVSIMERWGFTWGGNWLVPDAAHFEWVSPPNP
ncbi:MAG TPA: M15 family metallopeptidase [Acidimicrobiia bacterium]|nr:M15 family metallopeptidase [Acidimicrobiia bacterium]